MTRHRESALPLPNPLQAWENLDSGTGRCANTDPLLDRINLGIEGSGPVAIMPEDQSTVITPPNLELERMARADGCPECVGNAEVPRSVVETANGFRAAYLCGSCGHAWTTDWREDA